MHSLSVDWTFFPLPHSHTVAWFQVRGRRAATPPTTQATAPPPTPPPHRAASSPAATRGSTARPRRGRGRRLRHPRRHSRYPSRRWPHGQTTTGKDPGAALLRHCTHMDLLCKLGSWICFSPSVMHRRDLYRRGGKLRLQLPFVFPACTVSLHYSPEQRN